MMTGYHNQPAKTREAEWYDAQGNRYIRTGDVGRFDEDGFLTLMDRRKDMVISRRLQHLPERHRGGAAQAPRRRRCGRGGRAVAAVG